MINSDNVMKATNLCLRGASLAAKLLLTLYMGKYLSLCDLGVYGIVFSSAVIATGVLGTRLDYVVARALVGANKEDAFYIMRDQVVYYLINYALFVIVMVALGLANVASTTMLTTIFVISILENLANSFTSNLVSLGRPVLSTFLFFLRAGLWCFVVVALGLLYPVFRNVQTVMIGWAWGSLLGLLLALWTLRDLPWKKLFDRTVDWKWIKKGTIKCFPIWIGTVGAMTASSLDRFVVSYYLDLEKVGIITFYTSFAYSLLSLIHSGFFNFSYPRMIKYYQDRDEDRFWKETKQTALQVSVFVLLSAIALGIAIPALAPFFKKPELATESLTFWLILAGVFLRANADTFYYVLYARHRDKPLWQGDLLYLFPVAVGNVVFIPLLGLAGTGVTAIVSSLLLLGWWMHFALKSRED